MKINFLLALTYVGILGGLSGGLVGILNHYFYPKPCLSAESARNIIDATKIKLDKAQHYYDSIKSNSSDSNSVKAAMQITADFYEAKFHAPLTIDSIKYSLRK